VKRHVYEYDEVVIANNLPGVLYAFVEKRPLLYTPSETHKHDCIESFPALGHFFVEDKDLRLHDNTILTVVFKERLLTILLFNLSYMGLLPLCNKIQTIRREDDNLLKVVTNRSRSIRIKYKTLRVFNPEILHGQLKPKSYKVIDTFKYRGEKLKFDLYKGLEPFVKNMWIETTRTLHVESIIERKALDNFDTSVVSCRYRALEKLEPFLNDYFYLTFVARQTMPIFEAVSYHEENVIYDTRTEKEICHRLNLKKDMKTYWQDAYHWKMREFHLDFNGTIP